MASISPSTWNQLGFGVATLWVGLGLLSIFQSSRVAQTFGIHTAGPDATNLGLLISSRDLAIAATLFALGRSGSNNEMGTVILSTLIVAAADVVVVWRERKYPEYGYRGFELIFLVLTFHRVTLFAVGSSFWAFVGLGLVGSFE